MKLKSYMRGLGIGIVVTALIMGIATKDGQPMTDAEIKAAAAKLGMVDSSSLRLTDLNQDGTKPENGGAALAPAPEVSSAPEAGPTQEPASGPTAPSPSEAESAPEADSTPEAGLTQEPASEPISASTSPPEAEPIPEADSTPEAGPTQEPASEQTQTPVSAPASEESPETDTVKITVRSGTGSRAVCNQLADAGVIEDAAAFDQYLIDSGYSKRISSGTFEIPLGASLEEIAKIISKSQ